MKGYDIFYRAMALLGYTDGENGIEASDRFKKFAPAIINQIMDDLKCNPISKLSDEVNISAAKKDAICYGVAMLLSLIDGNAQLNCIYTNIYNSKRASALAENGFITDNFPNVVVG